MPTGDPPLPIVSVLGIYVASTPNVAHVIAVGSSGTTIREMLERCAAGPPALDLPTWGPQPRRSFGPRDLVTMGAAARRKWEGR